MTTSTTTAVSTICGPWTAIPYTSKNAKSLRYAAPKLAGDLRVHNLTGTKLCGWKPKKK